MTERDQQVEAMAAQLRPFTDQIAATLGNLHDALMAQDRRIAALEAEVQRLKDLTHDVGAERTAP